VLVPGTPAIDFTLKDQNNEEFTLSGHRGSKAVLVVFYPFAFTGICTGELNAIRDDPAFFSSDSVTTVTVSCDSGYAQKIFAERERFAFPLLSDFWPHGAVARAYGVFSESTGVALRGTFLVDGAGIVRFSERNGLGQGRDPQGWRDAIAALD
jgi:peroxiredoxin (alkyl hydroperoxide reductase subunit C)